MAEIPDSKADLISELSGDTNILSPQFCLKYPSAKTLFLFRAQMSFSVDLEPILMTEFRKNARKSRFDLGAQWG